MSSAAAGVSSQSISTAVLVGGVLVLVVGGALGLISRRLLRGRSSLSTSGAVLAGIVGALLGLVVTQLVTGNPSTPHPWVLLGLALAGTVVVLLLAEALVRRPVPDAEALVAAGESASVEFKSTARHNLHTGQRDDRMEAVIAKTIAGFLNGRGGTLLIGVDDAGAVLGLEDDLQHMKAPDLDRYELWLHDFLTGALGAPAVGLLRVTFPRVHGREVCRVDAAPSPRPVFVTGKGKGGGQTVTFYARLGNSTRELGVADAIDYAADHFGARGWRVRRVRGGA